MGNSPVAHPIAVSYAFPVATLTLSAYALIQRMNQGRKARVAKPSLSGLVPRFHPRFKTGLPR